MSTWSVRLLINQEDFNIITSVYRGVEVSCIYIFHLCVCVRVRVPGCLCVQSCAERQALMGPMSDWLGFDWGLSEAISDWARPRRLLTDCWWSQRGEGRGGGEGAGVRHTESESEEGSDGGRMLWKIYKGI